MSWTPTALSWPLTAALTLLAAQGPTRVPSVPPNTPIGPIARAAPVAVKEGRWQGFDPAEGIYVFFDVKGRQVTNLRFTAQEMFCRYEDGKTLMFPLTHSQAGSSGVLNVLPIPADGKLKAQIFASDSGHWFKINVAIFLEGKKGTVQMFGKSTGDPAGGEEPKDSCTFDTMKVPVEQKAEAQEPIKQPCGYPWSPPDCSNESPLPSPPVPPPGGD